MTQRVLEVLAWLALAWLGIRCYRVGERTYVAVRKAVHTSRAVIAYLAQRQREDGSLRAEALLYREAVEAAVPLFQNGARFAQLLKPGDYVVRDGLKALAAALDEAQAADADVVKLPGAEDAGGTFALCDAVIRRLPWDAQCAVMLHLIEHHKERGSMRSAIAKRAH